MDWTGHYSTNINLCNSNVYATGYRWTNLDLNGSLLDKPDNSWTDKDFYNSSVDPIHHWGRSCPLSLHYSITFYLAILVILSDYYIAAIEFHYDNTYDLVEVIRNQDP